MAKMTYEEAIAFMEQHATYCSTGTRPEGMDDEQRHTLKYWMRLSEYMNKKQEAEGVLRVEAERILTEMLEGTDADGVEVVNDNGRVLYVLMRQRQPGELSTDDLARIKPVGGIQ